MKLILFLCGIAAGSSFAQAQSNINESDAFAWASNIGWLNWRPEASSGVRIDEYVSSGFAYSANVGWIHFGSGNPTDGISYRNDSATDYGVNIDNQGRLLGMAYSANIGWINFEPSGNPKVDLKSGRLRGFAYAANVGWINLGEFNSSVSIDSLPPGADNDQDGIPDPWELIRAGNLDTLDSGADTDADGQFDNEEYLADTDPLNPKDKLQIINSALGKTTDELSLAWTARPTRSYIIQTRLTLDANEVWAPLDAPLPGNDSGTASIILTNIAALTESYFRIQAFRPLAP